MKCKSGAIPLRRANDRFDFGLTSDGRASRLLLSQTSACGQHCRRTSDAIIRVTVAGRPYAIDDRRHCFPVASRRVLPLSQSHPGIVDAVPDRKRP